VRDVKHKNAVCVCVCVCQMKIVYKKMFHQSALKANGRNSPVGIKIVYSLFKLDYLQFEPPSFDRVRVLK
jgi:hypothetical protein